MLSRGRAATAFRSRLQARSLSGHHSRRLSGTLARILNHGVLTTFRKPAHPEPFAPGDGGSSLYTKTTDTFSTRIGLFVVG